MLRHAIFSLLIFAPFFALPWHFEPRRDDSAQSIQALLHSDSPFAKAALNNVLATADPNLIIDGQPLIFHLGIRPCDPDRLERLLSRNADPNLTGPQTGYALIAVLRMSPFGECSGDKLHRMRSALIAHGARVNGIRDGDDTPLSMLLNDPWMDERDLDQLLKAGADPNEPGGTHHELPLDIALSKGLPDAVATLTRAGAKSTSLSRHLVKALTEGDIKFARTLLDQGAALSAENFSDLFRELLRTNASSNLTYYGAKATPEEVVRFLITLKPPLNLQMDGGTLLTDAVGSPVFRLFLEAGADPNFKGANGLSPIATIVLGPCSAHAKELQLLIEKHGNPNELLPFRTVYKNGRANWADTAYDSDEALDPSRKISLLEALLSDGYSLGPNECASILANAQTTIDKYAGRLLERFDKHLYYHVNSKIHSY